MVVAALVLRLAAILLLQTYDLSPERIHHIGPQEETQGTSIVVPEERARQFAFGFEVGAVAHSLAEGNGFSSPFGGDTGPTAWLGPVYPSLCALVFLVFGSFTPASGFVILSLNSLFSALTCIPIYKIGERTVGRAAASGAGWAWAALPIFWQWPTTWVWDMSISALLLSLLFWMTLHLAENDCWRLWASCGALWGLAALTNPSLLSFLPFSLLWAGYHLRQRQRRFIRPMAIACLLLFVVVVPWMIRNYLVFGEPVFIRGNFWFEFHLGNYHGSNGLGWGGKHPAENALVYEKYRRLGEIEFVEEAKRESLAFLRRYPGEFARLSLTRFLRFWDGAYLRYGRSHVEWWTPELVAGFSLLAFLGLALAFKRRVPGAGLYGLVLLFYPSIYYITYPQGRYRHAIEPVLLLLSAYFLIQIWRATRMRRLMQGEA